MADAIRTNGDVHQDGAGSHVNGDPPGAARYPSKGDELETAITPYFDAGPVDSSAVRFINGSKEDEARSDADGIYPLPSTPSFHPSLIVSICKYVLIVLSCSCSIRTPDPMCNKVVRGPWSADH